MKRYRGVTSNKQQLIQTLENTYQKATSLDVFFNMLKKQGLELYSRRGKITGISGSRRFRFSSLGYTKEILHLLDKSSKESIRQKALKQIRKHHLEQDLGRQRTRK